MSDILDRLHRVANDLSAFPQAEDIYAAISEIKAERRLHAEDSDVIESLRADAERYRWLRGKDINTIGLGGVFAGMTPDNLVLNENELDDAIDNERKQQAQRCHCVECSGYASEYGIEPNAE